MIQNYQFHLDEITLSVYHVMFYPPRMWYLWNSDALGRAGDKINAWVGNDLYSDEGQIYLITEI